MEILEVQMWNSSPVCFNHSVEVSCREYKLFFILWKLQGLLLASVEGKEVKEEVILLLE